MAGKLIRLLTAFVLLEFAVSEDNNYYGNSLESDRLQRTGLNKMFNERDLQNKHGSEKKRNARSCPFANRNRNTEDNLGNRNISDLIVYDVTNKRFIPQSPETQEDRKSHYGSRSWDLLYDYLVGDSSESSERHKFPSFGPFFPGPKFPFKPPFIPPPKPPSIPAPEPPSIPAPKPPSQPPPKPPSQPSPKPPPQQSKVPGRSTAGPLTKPESTVHSKPTVSTTKKPDSAPSTQQQVFYEVVPPEKPQSWPPSQQPAVPPCYPIIVPPGYPTPLLPFDREKYLEFWPGSQQHKTIGPTFVPLKKSESQPPSQQPGVKIPGFVPPKKPESFPPSQQPGFIISELFPPKNPESLPPSQQPGFIIPGFVPPKKPESMPPSQQPGFFIQGIVPPKTPESMPPSQQPGFFIHGFVPPKNPESWPPSEQPGFPGPIDLAKYSEFFSNVDQYCYNLCTTNGIGRVTEENNNNNRPQVAKNSTYSKPPIFKEVPRNLNGQ